MKKNREEVTLNWKCYSFSLGLVEACLLKQENWTPEGAMKFSNRLSKEVKKTVKDFFKRHPLKESAGCES